ncbi:hypothetical protein HAX54_023416, partial [Datura stramonium]|nr:hypothetical protein [Datura stramonium]
KQEEELSPKKLTAPEKLRRTAGGDSRTTDEPPMLSRRLGREVSTDDSSVSHRSRSAKRRCDAGSMQWPKAIFYPNQHFIGILPDLTSK